MERFKSTDPGEYIDLINTFEIKKREVVPLCLDPNKEKRSITMCVPLSLKELVQEERGFSLKDAIERSRYSNQMKFLEKQLKMRIDSDLIESFFDKPVKNTVHHIKSLLRKPTLKGCKAIVMVGGFSESAVLQNAIRNEIPSMKIVIPREAGLAVLKGATIFGFDPTAITERVCTYTYGTNVTHKYSAETCHHRYDKREKDKNGEMRCYNIFAIHARAGQVVKLGEELSPFSYTPITEDQEGLDVFIYRSKDQEPELVTDPGCEKIGYLSVPLPHMSVDTETAVSTSFLFGGTEILVKCTINVNGKFFEKRIDFLS